MTTMRKIYCSISAVVQHTWLSCDNLHQNGKKQFAAAPALTSRTYREDLYIESWIEQKYCLQLGLVVEIPLLVLLFDV